MATTTLQTSASPTSSTAQTRRAENGRPTGQKSNITRVRTGCFTCRKRKKKCDEKRPTCLNCQKTGIICEGYPQQVYWENRAAARRPSDGSVLSPGAETPVQQQQQKHVHMVMKETPVREPDLIFVPDGQAMLAPFHPTPMHNGEYDYMSDPSLDFMFDQLEEASLLSSSDGGAASVAAGIMTTADPFDALVRPPQAAPPNLHITMPNTMHPCDYIPNELPFLIPGVKSQLHRRLFCHFTSVLSLILSPSVRGGSPFNIVVIPVALRDTTVMNTLLALAGSHLLKSQSADVAALGTVDAERHRLHDEAITMQTTRFQNLKTSAAAGGTCSEQDQEVLFTTSLLLTLYEISEGSGSDAWRMHLDMAREVLIMGSRRIMNAPLTPTSPTSPIPPGTVSVPFSAISPAGHFITTDIHPFLLEFFQYHDAIANVTVALPIDKPRFQHHHHAASDLTRSQHHHEPYMIGVRDGLVDFIFRISTLRAQATASVHKPDGDVIIKAVAIWEELSMWRPEGALPLERQLMSEYYQWALFIWLFSVVYPEGKADQTVQRAVRRIAKGMHDIHEEEGVMSCLLFPLFVIGSAAVEEEDRREIRKHFHRLRSWSALGNVNLAHRVVEKLWGDHDLGVPAAWDWVKQMETLGMTLGIT